MWKYSLVLTDHVTIVDCVINQHQGRGSDSSVRRFASWFQIQKGLHELGFGVRLNCSMDVGWGVLTIGLILAVFPINDGFF